jgi:hypothetical protein
LSPKRPRLDKLPDDTAGAAVPRPTPPKSLPPVAGEDPLS